MDHTLSFPYGHSHLSKLLAPMPVPQAVVKTLVDGNMDTTERMMSRIVTIMFAAQTFLVVPLLGAYMR